MSSAVGTSAEAQAGHLKQEFHRVLLDRAVMEVPVRYQQLTLVGKGAFGHVCSANDTTNNMKVAIKKISRVFQTPVHAKRAFREIYMLKRMFHDNIIRLFDIFIPCEDVNVYNDVYLVTDFMQADLNMILKKQRLNDEQIQFLVYQILRGLKYVHSANVVHRDLKPSNVAVNSDCLVKILDFGLSREVDETMTGYVATRWWRAPEITYNWTHYNEKVDVWSVGCIMAEMITGHPLFDGKDQIDQLKKILEFLGTPSPELMVKFSDDAKKFVQNMGKKKKKDFTKVFRGANPLALDLLDRMLDLDPDTRISTDDALQHEYLRKYYDPTDEPVTDPSDHSYEKQECDIPTWRRKIYDEIMSFHPPELSMDTLE